jgi:hypothetical protein
VKMLSRFLHFFAAPLLVAATPTVVRSQTLISPTVVVKNGYDMDMRSDSRILRDEYTANGGVIPIETEPSPPFVDGRHLRRPVRNPNVQVNDPALDNVQIFPGFRPFVHYTESETSMAAFGQNVVVTYNSTAGVHLVSDPSSAFLFYDRILFSAFSASNDGGKTFHSSFFLGVDGDPFTYGDPTIDVDRRGGFYFGQLGETSDGVHGAITVNTSRDGINWNNAVLAAIDDGSDKPWLAVGRDPFKEDRDDVYVAWDSFQATGVQLKLAKSTDGGVTWTSGTVYAPSSDPDPTHPQNGLLAPNPVVDRFTGALYIPFLHFSNADSDFLQLLISKDRGSTFHFATFNQQGAPDSTLLPVVQPGELAECGATQSADGTFAANLRLVLHDGPDIGGSYTGLPRYVNATRLLVQPSIAVRRGQIFLAWNASDSPFFGDPNGHSNILFIRSDDGGATWSTPIRVNPPGDPHHVLPSLALDEDSESVHISYYTQHPDGSIDLDMANSRDGGDSFPASRTVRVSGMPFVLPPTNIPIPTASQPYNTTNYDRPIATCYALGEYQSAKAANGSVYDAWGDTRKTVTEPVNALDAISGLMHPQEDVFFQIVKVQ